MISPDPLFDKHPGTFLPHDVILAQLQRWRFRFRERRIASRANPHSGVYNFAARFTVFCRRESRHGALPLPLWRFYCRNRAMQGNVSGKVQHKAMIGVRLWPQPPAYHLHIQRRGHCGAQQGNQICVRRIKSGGEHIGVSQGLNLFCLKIRQNLRTFGFWCVSGHASRIDATHFQRLTHVLGMIHARTEQQPACAAFCPRNNFIHNGLILRLIINCGLQL